MQQQDAAWDRYGRAVIGSMAEVLRQTEEASHAHMLETADYWLSLGLSIGLGKATDAERLLAVILAHDAEPRAEMEQDADEFCREALL
jgi:hypothetical protein